MEILTEKRETLKETSESTMHLEKQSSKVSSEPTPPADRRSLPVQNNVNLVEKFNEKSQKIQKDENQSGKRR